MTKEDKKYLDNFMSAKETKYSKSMRRSSVALGLDVVPRTFHKKQDSFAPSLISEAYP